LGLISRSRTGESAGPSVSWIFALNEDEFMLDVCRGLRLYHEMEYGIAFWRSWVMVKTSRWGVLEIRDCAGANEIAPAAEPKLR
jgi:hypothetical protein